jgi:Platelet-activating factor acetylhydrolase, isoform II
MKGTLSCALILGSLALSIRPVLAQTAQANTVTATPTLPAPSGAFGIGRAGYEWIDRSRPDGYSSDPQAHRDLMVYLWYPSPRGDGEEAGWYLPGAKEMDADPDLQPHVREEFEAAWPLIVSGQIRPHAVENAPVASSPKAFPVVLFSHGAGSTSFEYTSLIEELVSHGYVVVGIEHTYTALAVEFPNGKIVPFHQEAIPANLSPDERMKRMMASAGLGISTGAADLVFVLNRLGQMDQAGSKQFLLSGRLDLKHVAAMGHSAGADFATRACQLDERIKACISLDGGMPPVSAFPEYPDGKWFQQPVLLLEVDHSGDRKPYSETQYNDYLKKKEAELNGCPIGSYHVVLKAPGLHHGSFSDYSLLAAQGRIAETQIAMHNLRLTQSFTLAFLNKYLKSSNEPLLDNATGDTEATVKGYGH